MSSYSSAPLLVSFTGSAAGPWRVTSMVAICGDPLPAVSHLEVREGTAHGDAALGAWTLKGVAGHVRYTTRAELDTLKERAAPLRRPGATRAALIPIRKTEAWWALAQDERRAIDEEQSRHTTIGLEYLPRIARRLHHCRDLGEPFDFLTWFEFAPEHEAAFDELLVRLRASPEWAYVDREIDIRLSRL